MYYTPKLFIHIEKPRPLRLRLWVGYGLPFALLLAGACAQAWG